MNEVQDVERAKETRGIDRVNEEMIIDYEGGNKRGMFRLHMDMPLTDDQAKELTKSYEDAVGSSNRRQVKALLLKLLPSNAPKSARRAIEALSDDFVTTKGIDRVNEEMVVDYESGIKMNTFRLHMDIPMTLDEAAELTALYEAAQTSKDKRHVKRKLKERLPSTSPGSAHRVIEALDDTLP